MGADSSSPLTVFHTLAFGGANGEGGLDLVEHVLGAGGRVDLVDEQADALGRERVEALHDRRRRWGEEGGGRDVVSTLAGRPVWDPDLLRGMHEPPSARRTASSHRQASRTHEAPPPGLRPAAARASRRRTS